MPNLLKRVLVAIIGIPLLLGAAIYGGWPLWVVIVILQAGALWEWRHLCRANGIKPNPIGSIIGLVGIDVTVWGWERPWAPAVLLIGLAAILLADVFRRERRPLRDLSAGVLFLVYAIVPLALWAVLQNPFAAWRWQPMGALAALFVTTWVCDTAAYFTGRSLGRHKLDVAASPNKTVEGFVGGLLFATATLPILAALDLLHPSLTDFIVLPLIVGFAGQVGDLLESLMKREAQVKDASGILPGHGGVLDRFDSLFLSTPLLFAYLVISST